MIVMSLTLEDQVIRFPVVAKMRRKYESHHNDVALL